MDRRTWLARGIATLACGGLAVLGRNTPLFAQAASPSTTKKDSDRVAKSDAGDAARAAKSRRIPPRLSTEEHRSVTAALNAADALMKIAAESSARGTMSGDAYSVALEQALTIRLHAAALHMDDGGRTEALRQHAAACRDDADRRERRSGVPGDLSGKSDAMAARARQAEAAAWVVAETAEANQVTKAGQRAADSALDLLSIRLQDARRGATRLDELAEAIHFAVRVVRWADERAASTAAENPPASKPTATTVSATKAPTTDATPAKTPATKKAAANTKPSPKPSEAAASLHKALADVRRFLTVRSERAKASRLEVGAQLVEIELARAATLIPERPKAANDAAPDPRDDAERLAEALFRRLIGDKAAGAEQVATALRLCWRRDEFHQTLTHAGLTVAQIDRNDVTAERRWFEQWSDRAVAGTSASAGRQDAPPRDTSRADASDAESRAVTSAQVSAMKSLVTLRRIDRRLADELAGKRTGDEPQPSASALDDLVRPKVLGAAERKSAKD